jgi:hypothetical protein
MRLGKAAVLGVVAGAVTIGLATPAMAETGDVIVRPGSVRPGDKVTVVGKKCQVDGTAGSLAFQGGAVPLNGAEEVDGRAGLATVDKGASPGTYTVLVRCGGAKWTGTYDVVDAKAAPKTRATPTGGAETGFGGVADENSLLIGGGRAMVLLGALGLGFLAARRYKGKAARR